MNLAYIKDQLAVIKTCTDDPERAHAKEDHLYAEFVQYIANNGTKEQIEMAEVLLTSVDIDFPRWYA